MKILRRYILREHVGPFIASMGVLTGLMLLNQLAKRFSDLVGKGLPWYVIAEVFGLSVPFILAMTMPMAVLVAVLYTFARLSGDNEITAIRAGGVSLVRFITPVIIAATFVAALMMAFNDRILPESNHKLRTLLSDIGRKQPTFELRERVINEVVDAKLFLQAARIDRMRSVLRDLVIFDVSRPQAQRTIYADSGHMAFDETQTDLYLTLYDGSMHELDPQRPGMDQRSYYEKQVIRVSDVTNELERGQSADYRGDREMNIAMMQAEVERRRARIEEFRDSLAAIVNRASPIRVREPERDEPPATERAEAAASRLTPGSDSAAVQPDSRVEIRERLALARRSLYPPEGNAVAFATSLRTELERTATRRDLHRREFNRFAVEIQKKFSIPVAAIVFVLIGAPIGIRFPRGGIGMVIGVSLTVFSVYYVFLIGGEEYADRNLLSPFWAMWAPNVLFAAIGCAILLFVSRTGTRRLHPVVARLRRLTGERRPEDAETVGEAA